MKTNFGKKLIASSLIALQLSGVAFANVSSNSVDNSAEKDLVAGVVALSGEKLSKEVYQSQVHALVAQYEQSPSSDEGRSERFAQAMADMKLISPLEISNIQANVDASVGEAIKANPNMSGEERDRLVTTATMSQMKRDYRGAQFAMGCSVIGVGIVIASIYANVYASTLTKSQNSTTQSGGGHIDGTATSTSTGNTSSTVTTTVSGTSTTTSSSVTADATKKKMLNVSAGIGYGIGGLFLLFGLLAIDGNGPCASY